MKFLIVLSVLVVCATAKPFFFKHPLLSGLLGGLGGGAGGSSSNAGSSSFSAPAPPPPEPVFVPAPPPPEPVYVPEPAPISSGPAPSSGGGHGGLGGLGNLIMIPLNIKKSLLQAHQAKFNKKIQHILGAFSKLGGGLGGGGGSSSHSSGNSISGPEPPLVPVGPPAPPPPPISYPPPIQPAPVSGLSGGSVDYNALGAGESSFSSSGSSSFSSGGSGLSSGGNVQTYHPQPAPETNYHKEPIVLYLYPVDQSSSHASSGSSSVNFQPAPPAPIAPRPDCNQPAVVQPQPAPFIPQPQPAPFIPEPAPFVPEPQPFIPEPVAPQQTYGPPDYQPAQPISNSYSSGTASSSSFDFEPQVVQPVPQPPNTYLPPSYKRRY